MRNGNHAAEGQRVCPVALGKDRCPEKALLLVLLVLCLGLATSVRIAAAAAPPEEGEDREAVPELADPRGLLPLAKDRAPKGTRV